MSSKNWKRNQWLLGFRFWAFRIKIWAVKDTLLFLVYERLDSESPEQKPLDGEAFALVQT
jgi:hypothetical protein